MMTADTNITMGREASDDAIDAGTLRLAALDESPRPVGSVDVVEPLRAALRECQDKLWIARCDSRDEAFRQAAEKASSMASEALSQHPAPVETGVVQADDGWLLIETAPKDGTWFLACSNKPGWGATRIVKFKYPTDRLPIHGEGEMWPSAPTHWMLLPEPPKPLDGGDG